MQKHEYAAAAPALWAALGVCAAHAACDKSAVTVFACPTAQGKRIEVCDAGKTINYSFVWGMQRCKSF